MACLFCNIASKKIPAEIIYEDAAAVAFLDIRPRAPAHTLVIPRHHAATLPELPETAIGPFFSAVKRVVGVLNKALTPNGFTLGINQGISSGQEVMHLHCHVLPRFTNDGGGAIQGVVNNPPIEDVKTIGERIRNTLPHVKS